MAAAPGRSSGIPAAAWEHGLEESDVKHESFSVGIMEGLKLAGLGLRMSKFIRKEAREGREPFMDPFGSYDVHSNVGVPCGGIGAGSIGRGHKGDFNSFTLRPGKPVQGTVKANQFSLYVKREGMPPRAAVLGCPVDSLEESAVKKDEEDTITMPHEEKLPEGLADAICAVAGHSEECDCSEDLEEIDIGGGSSGSLSTSADAARAEEQSEGTSPPEEEQVGADGSQSQRQTRSACLPRRTTYIKPNQTLSGWAWRKVQGKYHGLFPRAWTTYDVHRLDSRLKVECKQLSPVLAHNYKETSFPVTVFAWQIENTHPAKEVEVSLMFTFQNGIGAKEDYAGGHYNKPFRDSGGMRGCGAYKEEEEPEDFAEVAGVSMVNKRTQTVSLGPKLRATYEDPLAFGIAAKQACIIDENGRRRTAEDAAVHCASSFETTGLGKALWAGFSLAGKAMMVGSHHTSHSVEGVGIGSAVSSRVTVPANTTVEIVFSLSWDQPVVRFGQGRGYHPRYTRFYGISGGMAPQMCVDALRHWHEWDAAIEAWQNKILLDDSLPDSYKCSLFNQLYYFVAGGSVWLNAEETLATKQSLCLSDPTLHEQDEHLPQQQHEVLSSIDDLKTQTESVIKDFLALTDGLTEGVMLSTSDGAGKIIFSLDEIKEGVVYTTENGHTVRRAAEDKTVVLLNNTVQIKEHDGTCDLELPDLDGIAPPQEDGSAGLAEGLQMIDDAYGQLLYLESLEYQMYNTYDVHFYASFALVLLWPELELNIQRDFARAALIHAPSLLRPTLHSGEIAPRKIRGAIPHDVGCPGEDPLYNVNSYCIHDVNKWKDLNSKFALQVYRDYVATKNLSFLEDVFPVVWECMLFLERFDRDRDGVIENQNFPDQTYDTWAASGMSAYCGGLWLAALSASSEMAKILKKDEEHAYFKKLLERGSKVLHERLWNGKYFLYDSSGRHDDTVMADQLAGQWYCRATGLPPLFPEEDIRTALLSVFQHNFLSFNNGKMGVVNGYNTVAHAPERISFQAAEVWTGTTYGLAACMFQEGLKEEAWAIVNSMYNAIFKDHKYWFQVPEAWDERGRYRAFTYMRPLSIWAVQWAADIQDILGQDASSASPVPAPATRYADDSSAAEEQQEIPAEESSHAEDEPSIEEPQLDEPELDEAELEEPHLQAPELTEPELDEAVEEDTGAEQQEEQEHTATEARPANDSATSSADELAEVELSNDEDSAEAAAWPDDDEDSE